MESIMDSIQNLKGKTKYKISVKRQIFRSEDVLHTQYLHFIWTKVVELIRLSASLK